MFRLAVGLAFAAGASAQAPRQQLMPDIPPSHPDVETSSHVMEHSVDAVPVKQPLRVLCGFVNGGDSPMNISGIIGSLNDPQNFQNYAMNLTGYAIGDVVAPGEEITLSYAFSLPDLQEYPTPFQVALTVFYEDDAGQYYANTFFNETVTFTAPKASFELRSWSSTIYALVSTLVFAALVVEAIPFLKDRVSKVKLLDGPGVSSILSKPEPEVFDEDEVLNIKASGTGRPGNKPTTAKRSA